MKKLIAFSKLGLGLLATGCLICNTGAAQDSQAQKELAKQAAVKNWVESQVFSFIAQFALPMNGKSTPLTSDYHLDIKKEQVESWLPYFGQAYSAPIGQSNGGIQFKSKVFDYKLSEAKKGGWDIQFNPKDVQEDVYRFNLHISTSGYASLQVTSNNRKPISFNGYITGPK